MSKNLIVAIDGPAASGKSTTAKALAEKLDFIYVDTGAMYRAITYAALKNNIADNDQAVIELVKNLDVYLKFENSITRVFLNNEEITDKIRTVEVNAKVSDISRIPEVRTELVKIQKRMGEKGNLIAEGRDTTTVVFPEADLKIYLTAALDIRADRRYKEFLEKYDHADIQEVKENIEKRDSIDSQRKVSPLKKSNDAVEIDTTDLTIDEQVNEILKRIKELNKN
jgi:cytidylate kinase